jgi:hypothetical protein
VGQSTLNGVASAVRAFVLVSFDREAVLLGAVVGGSITAEKPEQVARMSRFVTTARHQRATEYQDPDPFGVLFVWRWKRSPGDSWSPGLLIPSSISTSTMSRLAGN